MRLASCSIMAACALAVLSCHPPASQRPSACDAAKAFTEMLLADMSGRSTVFSTEPFDLVDDMDEVAPDAGGKLTAAALPPQSLVDSARRQGATNAIAQCDAVRDFVLARRISVGTEAVKNGLRQDADGAFASSVIGISLPSVSSDGRTALVGLTIASGTLDGVGMMLLMEKQPTNRWQVIAEYQLYIS